uniref:Uncharacterized protein n=1 Tax=viral metagenome TaxID=1070528 RepID=A0A6C0HTN5_9ZZZZ
MKVVPIMVSKKPYEGALASLAKRGVLVTQGRFYSQDTSPPHRGGEVSLLWSKTP